MATAPNQPPLPGPPWDQGAKPPWRPRVSGIAGFLCGPVAAALIAFINLRRLNERRKAAWTLTLTILASAVFGLAIAKVPDNISTVMGKLIGHIVSPFLFPLLQKRAFDEWETSHPGATHGNGWRSAGWAILGLAAFYVIAIGSAVLVSSNGEVRNIELRYGMPEKAKVGETFVFAIQVQNTADHPQLLHSLDVDTHFLDGISIQRTTPAFEKSEPNMLAPIRSYIFKQTIPPKGTLEIELQCRAQKPGSFPLGLDVCVKTALTCSSFKLSAIAVQ
ncbi:MAG: hypothetical protein HY508_02785 [Acidobacteria bacterium]|nr:hypothetical protein [Acidobacteriota bacterium]